MFNVLHLRPALKTFQPFSFQDFDPVFAKASQIVEQRFNRKVTFTFFGHLDEPKPDREVDPESFLLFQFKEGNKLIPIDILSLISKGEFKKQSQIAEELAMKVDRYYRLVNIVGIHISQMGAILDARNASPHTIGFNSRNRLTLNNVIVNNLEGRHDIARLAMHSTTALCFYRVDNRIWVLDRETIIEQNKGLYIDLIKDPHGLYRLQSMELDSETKERLLYLIDRCKVI